MGCCCSCGGFCPKAIPWLTKTLFADLCTHIMFVALFLGVVFSQRDTSTAFNVERVITDNLFSEVRTRCWQLDWPGNRVSRHVLCRIASHRCAVTWYRPDVQNHGHWAGCSANGV